MEGKGRALKSHTFFIKNKDLQQHYFCFFLNPVGVLAIRL